MIKLCFLSSNYNVCGLEKLLHDLCRRLDRSKFHLTICLLRSQGDFIDMMLRDFPEDTCAFDLGSPLRWWNVLEVVRFLKHKQFDVIQAFGFRSDLISRMVKRGASKPCIIGFVANPQLPNAKLKALTNYFSSGLVDRFWADCEYRSRHGAADLRIPAEKIGVIYPGIDSTIAPDASAVRTELNIPANTPVIGAVGNLRFVKGYHVLLKAAPAILRKFPSAIFLLVGADLTNSKLPNLIRNSDVASSFRLLGFRADAIRCMSVMDIVAQPSLSEGLPRSVLEAMSLGKPVVASRVGGIPEIIEDDWNGSLVPPNDSNALAQKAIDLLSDASRREALGDHGYRTINEKFQIDRMICEFDKLYSCQSFGAWPAET